MVEFILYVENQEKSKEFYQYLLNQQPVLHVPGMTEFQLTETTKLGLMPEAGIIKIIGNEVSNPKMGNGIPRCELYLKVKDVNQYISRGMEKGAKLISPLQLRSWGDNVGYLMDKDGHIIAFAEDN